MTCPTWVIDTNVLVSAALTPGGPCQRIVRAGIDGRIRFVWNAPMLAKYRAVLTRPKFKLSRGVVEALLHGFGPRDQVALIATPPLPDPDDACFLAAALQTPDRILVTGNAAHFPKEACTPVIVLTPAEALARLAKGG